MKIRDIKDYKDYLAEAQEGESDSYTKFKELNQLNYGYAQLARLSKVLKTGDWGALIDISGRLNQQDIGRIKVQLHDIIFNNPLLIGYNTGSSADNYEQLRLLGHAIGHGTELLLESAITAILASLAAVSLASGVLSWTVPAELAGAAAVGAFTPQQARYLADLKAGSDLLDIINAYDNIGSYQSVKRGLFRRFLDWIEHKTPQQIHAELSAKARVASAQAQNHFDELIQKLPPTVTYWDGNTPHSYPTIKLFELP